MMGQDVRPVASEQVGYVVAAGTTPDGKCERIIVESDGTARLSDETVERIARRVVELMRMSEREAE
jgi:hypothetical protein